MPHPRRTTTLLSATITGNVTAQEMLQDRNGRKFGYEGVEAGGRIVLETATSVKVLIVDATGKVLHTAAAAVTGNEDIAPIPAGIKGPIYITTTEISNAAHTLTVYWSIKR